MVLLVLSLLKNDFSSLIIFARDVSKTDELLTDFLNIYKVDGVHGDQDPKLATFECL